MASTRGLSFGHILCLVLYLFDGEHKSEDPFGHQWPKDSFAAKMAGKPVCGGLFNAIIWLDAMDAEYACNELKWPHYSCAGEICGYCPARAADHRDYRKTAPFKQQLYNAGATDTKVSNHPHWQIPGVSRFTYRGDEMHGLALGPLQWLHASAMWSLLSAEFGIFGPGAVDSRIQLLWGRVTEAYIACGTEKRITNLSIGMVGGNNHLPALSCKAMEARGLIRPMLHIFESLNRVDDRLGNHDRHVIGCYTALLEFYDVVETNGLFLSDNDSTLVLASIDRFLLHYNWLCSWSRGRGETMYKLTTKHHSLWHLAYFARYMSPRASWTYSFEDFVGKVKRLGKAVVDGTPVHKVAGKIWQNYRIILADVMGMDLSQPANAYRHRL